MQLTPAGSETSLPPTRSLPLSNPTVSSPDGENASAVTVDAKVSTNLGAVPAAIE
ncbi:hypothetical protein [Mesorhizobium sp. ORM16]|uniref:hypothetical protein n=1 Tax=Mesorhizobium sp. ORM16 TaxID=3376989 RepID=UPI0038577AC8